MNTPKQNPFAPPSVGLDGPVELEPDFELGLLRRDGELLIIPNNAALPPRCMVTGKPTRCSVRCDFSWQPQWLYWLLLPGILPYLLVAGSFRQSIQLNLPISRAIKAKHERLVSGGMKLVTLAFIAFVLITALSMLSFTRSLSSLEIVPLLVGLLGYFIASRQPVKLKIVFASAEQLVLKGIHPDYMAQIPHV